MPGPGVPVAAEEEESLLEESLFFDADEPSQKESWPRTRRFWRRLRGDVRYLSASWLEPRQFRERDRSLPRRVATRAARATQSLRRELALNRTASRYFL